MAILVKICRPAGPVCKKDHLGSTRVTFRAGGRGEGPEVVQAVDYYPFGLVMSRKENNGCLNYL